MYSVFPRTFPHGHPRDRQCDLSMLFVSDELRYRINTFLFQPSASKPHTTNFVYPTFSPS